jgi:hypothetical protein
MEWRLISDLEHEDGACGQLVYDGLYKVVDLTVAPGLETLEARKLDLSAGDPGEPFGK